jgi:hypothetical protein
LPKPGVAGVRDDARDSGKQHAGWQRLRRITTEVWIGTKWRRIVGI